MVSTRSYCDKAPAKQVVESCPPEKSTKAVRWWRFASAAVSEAAGKEALEGALGLKMDQMSDGGAHLIRTINVPILSTSFAGLV